MANLLAKGFKTAKDLYSLTKVPDRTNDFSVYGQQSNFTPSQGLSQQHFQPAANSPHPPNQQQQFPYYPPGHQQPPPYDASTAAPPMQQYYQQQQPIPGVPSNYNKWQPLPQSVAQQQPISPIPPQTQWQPPQPPPTPFSPSQTPAPMHQPQPIHFQNPSMSVASPISPVAQFHRQSFSAASIPPTPSQPPVTSATPAPYQLSGPPAPGLSYQTTNENAPVPLHHANSWNGVPTGMAAPTPPLPQAAPFTNQPIRPYQQTDEHIARPPPHHSHSWNGPANQPPPFNQVNQNQQQQPFAPAQPAHEHNVSWNGVQKPTSPSPPPNQTGYPLPHQNFAPADESGTQRPLSPPQQPQPPVHNTNWGPPPPINKPMSPSPPPVQTAPPSRTNLPVNQNTYEAPDGVFEMSAEMPYRAPPQSAVSKTSTHAPIEFIAELSADCEPKPKPASESMQKPTATTQQSAHIQNPVIPNVQPNQQANMPYNASTQQIPQPPWLAQAQQQPQPQLPTGGAPSSQFAPLAQAPSPLLAPTYTAFNPQQQQQQIPQNPALGQTLSPTQPSGVAENNGGNPAVFQGNNTVPTNPLTMAPPQQQGQYTAYTPATNSNTFQMQAMQSAVNSICTSGQTNNQQGNLHM